MNLTVGRWTLTNERPASSYGNQVLERKMNDTDRGGVMKVWKAQMYDSHNGTLLSWHASRREAESALADFQRKRGEPPVGPEGVEAVDIPVRRTGLIAWLNRNFNTDNG